MASRPAQALPLDIDVEERRAQAQLLAWYDRQAADLPWRVSPQAKVRGIRPDPYIVWISEIMLQQTTRAAVIPRLTRFLARFPDVRALADAPMEAVLQEWAGMGYYARARALHGAAQILARSGMPSEVQALQALPGIGPYTARAIAAIAFDAPQAPVDANIARILARLHAMSETGSALRNRLQAEADRLMARQRPGDWAQALMDLGAKICRPIGPDCGQCPLAKMCKGRAIGPEKFPASARAGPKPLRRGICFFLRNSKGEVWLERRPNRGLMGGMLGLPGSPWTEEEILDPLSCAPAPAPWRRAGSIRHTFTHFHLELAVMAKQEDCTQPSLAHFQQKACPGLDPGCSRGFVSENAPIQGLRVSDPTKSGSDFACDPLGEWIAIGDWQRAGLPSVFVKAARLASTVDFAAQITAEMIDGL